MKKYSSDKDIDRLVRRCIRKGWTYRRGTKHGLLSPPNCRLFVAVPGTPSDGRAWRNFERDLKQLYQSTTMPDHDACLT